MPFNHQDLTIMSSGHEDLHVLCNVVQCTESYLINQAHIFLVQSIILVYDVLDLSMFQFNIPCTILVYNVLNLSMFSAVLVTVDCSTFDVSLGILTRHWLAVYDTQNRHILVPIYSKA